MTVRHSGGCRCGKVRFSSRAEPHFASYCHCVDCRRASGAPVAAFVGFHEDEITWDRDEYAIYESGPATRLFCATCGAPVAYRDSRVENRTYFMIGAMDDPNRYPPEAHAFAGEQLSWLPLNDDLPHFPATVVARPTQD